MEKKTIKEAFVLIFLMVMAKVTASAKMWEIAFPLTVVIALLIRNMYSEDKQLPSVQQFRPKITTIETVNDIDDGDMLPR